MISTAPLQQTEVALTRLIEANQRQKVDKAINAPVATLETALGKLFVKQGNALVRALTPLQTFFKEASINQQFDAIFDAATENTSLDMMVTLEKAYKSAILLGGTNQLAETGIKISFKLDNPRANAYIAKYGGDLISGIDDTTRQDMRNLLHASIENGDSFNRLAQQIKARYQQYAVGQPQQHIRSRAHLIAVTEYGNGYQAGNYASMQAAQDSGVKILKKWSTIGDTRVSEGCRQNAAQDWIPINQQFQSGHMHPLRFPGDRCVALYKRDTATKTVAKTPKITSTQLKADDPINQRFGKETDNYRTFTNPASADTIFGEKYFRSWETALSNDEREALKGYQQQTFGLINDTLRGHRKADAKQQFIDQQIGLIDSGLKTARVPYNVVSFRGFVNPGVAIGDTFTDAGYSSTSLSSAIAVARATGHTQGAVARIKITQGTVGGYLDAITPIDQAEILLPRGTTFKVTASGKETINGKEVTVIDLEIA
jgi:hypothetical protein